MGWAANVGSLVGLLAGFGAVARFGLSPLQKSTDEVKTRVSGLATKIDDMGRDLEQVSGQVRSVCGQVESVTEVLVPVLVDRYQSDTDKLADLLHKFNGSWRAVTAWEQSRQNPLTAEELERFEEYRVKFFTKRQRLTRDEWEDFRAMVDKMNQENPQPPQLADLRVLSAIFGALTVAAPAPEGKQKDRGPSDGDLVP